MSLTKFLPGPNTLKPPADNADNWLVNPAKSKVVTVNLLSTLMMDTVPAGSVVYASLGSPSLAVRMNFPSELNTTWSGSEPTLIDAISLYVLVLKTTTLPGACLLVDSIAAANMPFFTSTLFTYPP